MLQIMQPYMSADLHKGSNLMMLSSIISIKTAVFFFYKIRMKIFPIMCVN